MMWLIGAFVTLLVLVLTCMLFGNGVKTWITWIQDIKYLRSLPSPPKHWILGHSLKLGTEEDSLQYVQSNHQRFPKFCVYWFGPLLPMVHTANVEVLKKLFQRPEEPKSPVYRYLIPWIGDGLLVTSGAKWRRYRKLLTPAFHSTLLHQYMPVHNEITEKLLEIWAPLANSGKSVDITEYTPLLTLDVLLRCMFSINSNCLEEGTNVVYLKAISELGVLLVKRAYNPFFAIDWIFNASPMGHKFNEYCDIVHKFSIEVVKQRREELLKGFKSQRKYLDFVDILLSTKDENGEGLTDTEIREEVDTFVFEGHDTTAAALGWCLYCMAKYKEHQDLCRKEVREILAGRDSDEITVEDIPKLIYTTMCIKESLRLYPPVPDVSKRLTEDVTIDGNRIPKGTWMELSILTLHHSPFVWDCPETFNPLRFNLENSKNRDPFAYVPFAAGPRNCIGQQFATHEMKVVVARTLNKFELEVDPDHIVRRRDHAILKASTGIKVKINYATQCI